jgi:hypothetical protein
MLLDEIKNVLSFAAFRPDEDDADIPWNKRFEGRRTLLLNIGRSQTSWRSINKKGELGEAGFQDGEFADRKQILLKILSQTKLTYIDAFDKDSKKNDPFKLAKVYELKDQILAVLNELETFIDGINDDKVAV